MSAVGPVSRDRFDEGDFEMCEAGAQVGDFGVPVANFSAVCIFSGHARPGRRLPVALAAASELIGDGEGPEEIGEGAVDSRREA